VNVHLHLGDTEAGVEGAAGADDSGSPGPGAAGTDYSSISFPSEGLDKCSADLQACLTANNGPSACQRCTDQAACSKEINKKNYQEFC